MVNRSDAEAVLLTGTYGSGKTSMVEEIERRLGDSVTAGRQDDLRVAREWVAAGRGDDVGDQVIENNRPIRETALQVVSTLGW